MLSRIVIRTQGFHWLTPIILFFCFTLSWVCIVAWNNTFIIESLTLYIFIFAGLVFVYNNHLYFPKKTLISFTVYIVTVLCSWLVNLPSVNQQIGTVVTLLTRFSITLILTGYLYFSANNKKKVLEIYYIGSILSVFLLILFDVHSGYRYWLPNGNPNALGFMLAISIVIGLYLKQIYEGKVRKLAINFSLLYIGYGLYLTWSRSAISIITLIFLLNCYRKIINYINKKYFFLTCIILLLVIVFIGMMFPSHIRFDYNLDNRIPVWIKSLNIFLLHPFFGFGPGSFEKVFYIYAKSNRLQAPENVVIMQLVETGLLGATSLVCFLYYILKHVSNFNGQEYNFRMNLYCVLMCFIFTQTSFYEPVVWFGFALILS